MQILNIRALRGPNFYSQKPMINMVLDLEELEKMPSDKVPDMGQRLLDIMPSLIEHTCSPGVRGGFISRVERGTWAGHIAEHIAIELQNILGYDISFGKTYTLKEKGQYRVVYRYINEEVGIRAGELAVLITKSLFDGTNIDMESILADLHNAEEKSKFGPSTQAIVDEAIRRNIPYYRLNERSYVQFGQGKNQRRIEATITGRSSYVGVSIAGDKERTKEILGKSGIKVPMGETVTNIEEAIEVSKRLKFPLVTKPIDGNHGRGVTLDINSIEDLIKGFEIASVISEEVLVERYLNGFDFRILVIDGKFEAAALREPAYVTGDGEHNISELIDIVNASPDRGEGHEKVLTKITIDNETMRVLCLNNMTLKSIPKIHEKVYIKYTANLSSGGTAIDVTDEVHIDVRRMAERISRVVGLDIIGIDVMAKSLKRPLTEDEGIVEVNAAPGLRMHLKPCQGKARNVAESIMNMFYKENEEHSIPICAVTGTNGKTTTTRLINHILKKDNKVVGMTSTDGVVIDGYQVQKGDYSGPGGAREVFLDSSVEVAVLEVARGGIMRRGLGFKKCDVGVLLNVQSDHLGFDGIETLEDLLRAKSTVTESVKRDGYAVFNADDELCIRASEETPAKVVFFSDNPNNQHLKKNLLCDNFNVTLMGNDMVIQKSSETIEVVDIKEIPICYEGNARFNVLNSMAAVAACYGMGVDVGDIRAGLLDFNPENESSGRMQIYDLSDFKIIVDYGHNVHAIESTGEFIGKLGTRKIRMASGVGNRREEDIIGYGKALAKYYDEIVLCDSSPRIRKTGETLSLVREGLIQGGMDKNKIKETITEDSATFMALEMLKKGDVLVLQAEDIKKVTEDVKSFIEKYKLEHGE